MDNVMNFSAEIGSALPSSAAPHVPSSLTEEQLKVISHPMGMHARVLAVAGSGKTTTMAYRVKHLVENLNVHPSKIQVLMFNKAARQDFLHRLESIGVGKNAPRVDTFHSFGFNLINECVSNGWAEGHEVEWIGDREELSRITIIRIINELERQGVIEDRQSVDLEEVMEAISLYKNTLIPPERAGHLYGEVIPTIYARYEEERLKARAITYDDMVSTAVDLLETNSLVKEGWSNRFRVIIVDEYQDVNLAQQRLIELLADGSAEIMVVGDDDQTIYEWRGARPSYILRDCKDRFHYKPFIDYKLSHSFRFGPVLAQAAENCISKNRNRMLKSVISHRLDRDTRIKIMDSADESGIDVDRAMADFIEEFVELNGGDVSGLAVLCRTYSQLGGIERELVLRGLPYRVDGKKPFFDRQEVRKLLNYVRLALVIDDRISTYSIEVGESILNIPNRRLPRRRFEESLGAASERGQSFREGLAEMQHTNHFSDEQKRSLADLAETLNSLRQRIDGGIQAHAALEWLVDRIKYLRHYDEYFGPGIESAERKQAILNILTYAQETKLMAVQFIEHLSSLDTTRGYPKEFQLLLTTIFKAKGLEFDHVLMPECSEGCLPILGEPNGTFNLIFDKAGLVQNPPTTDPLENERRLFYVGITRARESVIISTGSGEPGIKGKSSNKKATSRFVGEMNLEASEELMDSFIRHLREGCESSAKELTSCVLRNASCAGAIRNLVDRYMPESGMVEEANKIRAEIDKVNIPTEAPKAGFIIKRKENPPVVNPWLHRRTPFPSSGKVCPRCGEQASNGVMFCPRCHTLMRR